MFIAGKWGFLGCEGNKGNLAKVYKSFPKFGNHIFVASTANFGCSHGTLLPCSGVSREDTATECRGYSQKVFPVCHVYDYRRTFGSPVGKAAVSADSRKVLRPRCTRLRMTEVFWSGVISLCGVVLNWVLLSGCRATGPVAIAPCGNGARCPTTHSVEQHPVNHHPLCD